MPPECKYKLKPILNIEIFVEHPYVQITFDEQYQTINSRADKDLMNAIFAAVSKWKVSQEKVKPWK